MNGNGEEANVILGHTKMSKTNFESAKKSSPKDKISKVMIIKHVSVFFFEK
ncbi:hypothetical protein [Streptococcus ruminicola]|uniref:Uncharacterized protein n=1 Tax=Streptococcus equinus JB1 TaxID=1294274 RepID=A0A091BV66_STREI|nr:hypothetical protein [Streptococcus ruminicola]KFN88629.1 hypothetical protein H702_01985 [Streptococcus equinus JB1]